ncbi:SMC-Scp complex subunit ScpB [Aureliella helgolandensis]|uniref:Segregation and condensation protein B n=1 Tax=Aureliella helgolandensis TaxID=2527968 RepID=A0A518G3W4_9BACT|nr:SMC-Scp complex subunit ScpB [Aureliella helgolandensis]QDV23284.1 hypothetical protein Q31a_15820 [Aureliella helgolandensis]
MNESSTRPTRGEDDGDDELDGSEYEEEAGLSLEELSQTYANVVGQGVAPYQDVAEDTSDDAQAGGIGIFDPLEEDLDETGNCPVTPMSILESILFVGRPDNGTISAAEIAGLMRGVREAEVEELVQELNDLYEQTGRAIRISQLGNGYKAELARDLNHVKDQFYGRARDVRLNQAAIDCLALIAYQPGISRDKLEEQRGQPCGSVLNQLVRRELLEIRRVGKGKEATTEYYTTQRLLELAGLDSLEDLPHAEDWE